MIEEYLNRLRQAVCEELLKRITSGTAASGDIANAIRFLKESGSFPEKQQPVYESVNLAPCPLPDDDELKSILGDDYR